METLLLIVLDVILGAVAYFLYISIFIPTMKKNALYAKLTAKQRLELDNKLGLQEYFGYIEEDKKK